jgi:hypothetical protein
MLAAKAYAYRRDPDLPAGQFVPVKLRDGRRRLTGEDHTR